ncbi:small s [Fusarium agapanthi]|uniref:Small s n=1 Tax=Fusarium agapanthi TaxID=1803897 RepID=A0A9P5E398_9HYPO|nr:small s [Fusarium agapanthi]
MSPLQVLNISSIIFRYSGLVGNLIAISSAAQVPPGSPPLRYIYDQLLAIQPELIDRLFSLQKEKPPSDDKNFTDILNCARACVRDCNTLLKAAKTNLERETQNGQGGQLLRLVDQLFVPPFLRSLQGAINEYTRPGTRHLANTIICHLHGQLEDIENRFNFSLGCEAFEELQRSTGLVDAQFGQIPCGTEAWDEICDRLQHILSNLHHLQMALPMLSALNHSERSLRQSRILKALEGTFSWAFQEQTDDTILAHSSLRRWLTSDHSLFWVTGKPCSGKSTLMKFVSEHQDTRNLLQKWAGHRELLIVNHYFDATGLPIQKSLEGLLRSLVFGILSAKPSLLKNSPSSLGSASSTLPATFKLGDILSSITRNEVPVNICFFIDGLDEYEGDHAKLCQLMEDISSLPHVKVIVSSRPLAVFDGSLNISSEAKLSMEEVNRSDISRYITFHLEGSHGQSCMGRSKYKDLDLEALSAQAQGDFLWAVLVTRFLLPDPPLVLDAYNGAENAADIPNNLPGLAKIVTESSNFQSCGRAAEYLTIAREAKRCLAAEILYFHNFDFADDMYAFMTPKDLLSTHDEETKELHHQIYRDIIQTCGGLLEVVDGQVVFVHRAVLELIHSEEFHNYLLTKVRKGFDSDLSVFKASVSWFKRKSFRSGEFVDLQPEPAAVILAYVKSLSKFHKRLGRTKKSRTWRVPIWFKFLMLAHWVPTFQQAMFERVFSMMLEKTPDIPDSRALLELKSDGETYEWIPFPLWAICTDNFALPTASDSSPSDADFLFRVFAGVCEKNLDNLEVSERSRKYLSSYFLPDYPELRRQILMLIPGSDSRTIGFTTITSATRDRITDSISGRDSTVATTIELPEGIEVESTKEGAACNSARVELDAIVDEVGSIQSIDEDIQSNNSSIARTPGIIAAERQIGEILSRDPDLRFIIDISSALMPKEKLERNIRRSLKLLYLKLREHAEKHIEIQVLTTRMLKGRNEKPPQPADQTDGTKLTESDDDVSEEIQSDSDEFQAVQVAEEFLMKGPPFQAFLVHLGLSLLPDTLRQVMQLAAWDTIELIDTPAEVSLSDKIKSSVEKLTGSPWDWWPLKTPEVPLRRGYVRMNWVCHCSKPFRVDITPSQARIIERMTKNPTTFAEDHHKVTHIRRNAFQRVTAWFKWNSGALLPVSTPVSQDSQQPSGVGGNNNILRGWLLQNRTTFRL